MAYSEHKNFDTTLIVYYVLLVIFGWMNIYAACLSENHQQVFDFSVQYGKQIIWILSAVLVCGVFLSLNAHIIPSFAYVVYGVAMLCLVATLFVGSTTNGAQSWIDFGFFKFQPSEFAKFATILALSKYVSGANVSLKQRGSWITILAIIGVPALLVLLQHDMGSALVFCSLALPLYRFGMTPKPIIIAFFCAVLFILALAINHFWLILLLLVVAVLYLFVWLNHPKVRDIVTTVAIFVVCVAFVCLVKPVMYRVFEKHQIDRIMVLVDPNVEWKGVGYNVRQAKIAIGSGGLTGKGFTNGTITKADFIPEQETDFIFCTVGEEWGFVGSAGVLVVYILMLLRIIKLADEQYSFFSKFYGYCIVGIFFIHLLINVGMVIGLMPVIGIPLPFFSYGGSSMLFFSLMLFVFIRLDAEKTNPV